MSDLSPFPLCPSLGSLSWNGIGDEGASALAAVLKETMITDLKCAAAPECLLSCQRPLTSILLASPMPCLDTHCESFAGPFNIPLLRVPPAVTQRRVQ